MQVLKIFVGAAGTIQILNKQFNNRSKLVGQNDKYIFQNISKRLSMNTNNYGSGSLLDNASNYALSKGEK